jgi:hypothetical protein
MPVSLDQARANLEAARAASEELRNGVAASERNLKQLSRSIAVRDPRLEAAKKAHAAQLKSLQIAQERERAAHAVLDGLLSSSLLADGAADVARLTADFPIVLLPVRIETRFAKDVAGATSLKVRIYPDELMADTHEPPLTEAEREAGLTYWRAGWQPENEKDAWRALVANSPAPRAAWIVRTLTPTNLASRPTGAPVFPDTASRVGSWTRAAETRVLPDRWVVIGYRGAREVIRGVGLAIQEPLALSMNPTVDEDADTIAITDDGLKLDDALAWTVDFDRAVKAGMALTLPPSSVELSRGLDRLVVVGVKSSLAPNETAKRLGQLLDAHHYTKGLAFLPQGTPTNNTTDAPSGFPVTDSDGALSFAVERGAPLTGPDSNGTLFARALGLPEELTSHVAGGDLHEQPNAHAMNEALWPVTWRYFLDQMMDPVATDNAIELARGHFTDHVRARGPLPAFRTGATPYGVLPVSSLARWTSPATAGPVEPHLVPLLRNLSSIWMQQVPRVPRMGATDNPDDDLLAVLGMDASTRQTRVRTVLGPDVQSQLFATLNIPTITWLSNQRIIIQQLMTQLGHPEWSPRIGSMSFADAAKLVGAPFVANAPLSETEPLQPFNYINWVRTASLTQLQQEQLPQAVTRPNALLYLLLRHAALSLYSGVATKVAIKNNLATRADRIESEVVGVTTRGGPRRAPAMQHLHQKIPLLTGNKTLAEFLLDNPPRDDAAEILDFRAALEQLESLPVAELDRLCTETLDACSHRLDAWITSLAAKRLDEMRQSKPLGSHLGAFGWVENLCPDTTPSGSEPAGSGGYIHAPSASHAATAAILRNAYLTHSGQNSERYAVDLSSARVRGALELLDAVRQGQPLGAVLGYRFERGLHEGHLPRSLDKYIDPFRRLYPLVADKGGASGEAVESIAARNVVDGLLMRAALQAGTIPWGQSGLPPNGNDRAAIEAELHLLDDAVDAVADVLTSESVFQLVRGNSGKAASVLDSIGQGLRPPEPEITVQPRGGTALTHRVAIVLGGDPLAASGWSAVPATPRSQVEPYLDAWAGSLLGEPAKVRCQLSYRDSANQQKTKTISLAQLKLRPLDVLALTRSLDAQPTASELDARITSLAPAAATDLKIQYAPGAAWDRAVIRTFPDVLEVARTLNALLSGSRPLDPKDLLAPEESQAADGADRLPVEAAQRASSAETALNTARNRLQTATQASSPNVAALRKALRSASLFGVATAFPTAHGTSDAVRDAFLAQAAAVMAELDRRSAASTAATVPADKVQAVFEQDYIFLPRFHCANVSEMNLALGYGPALVGDASAVTKWMQQASRVRTPLASWRQLSLLVNALDHPPLSLQVAQLPHAPNARWVGLPFATEEERPESGRLSLVLHQAAAPATTAPWVGLLVDEWSELIPARTEDTAIAFHYDDPGAEAAQTVLIAVPPTQALNWDLSTLLDTLNETLDLAKMRAVDGELVPMGQLLPAIYLATNPSNDAVSTDLHGVLVNVVSASIP